MDLHEFVKLLRTRWLTVASTALISLLAAIAVTVIQTPLYQASTRLFVSTASGSSAADLYQGNRLSQERVLSYTQLITGQTLAQRTIDRLNLDMSATTLKARVTAKARPNTVLIAVAVLDESPVRARDIADALSDEFVQMAKELETPGPGAKPDARVIVEQRATIPKKPAAPQPARNIALGAMLGAIAGVFFALVRDRLDNTIKSPESLEVATGVNPVGYIPLDKKLQAEPAISFDTDNSVTAESFRKLRTNLQFLNVDHPPRVIVITSGSPSEGKSCTSINVALALAEAGRNVVLVDGDLRRPRLAERLNLLGSVGVSTVLSGVAPLDQVLQETRFSNLTLLASGPTPPNPSELLSSFAAKKMLGELRSKFDYVIIDSSPLLAVTDGAVLATEADGTLVAVRAGKTKRDHVAHAVQMLNDVGARVLGTVMTMTPTRGSTYAYTYNYYGGYGSEGKQRKSLDADLERQKALKETVTNADL